jgi:hypothetical protein
MRRSLATMSWAPRPRQVLGLQRDDQQRGSVSGTLARAGVFHQHPNTRGQVRRPLVQVGLDGPVEVRDTTQLELLADLGREIGDGLLDRLVPGLGGLERFDVVGLGCDRGRDDLIGERLELIVLRDEIGLGVQLDQRRRKRRPALGGRPLGALADVLAPLMRSTSTALSKSPSVSVSAFLQSSMPAPVSSRSRLTSAAV